MTNLPPEIMLELNRRRIQEELAAIRLEEKAEKGNSLLNRNLAALGEWMVARGEQLRKRHSTTQTGSSELIGKVT